MGYIIAAAMFLGVWALLRLIGGERETRRRELEFRLRAEKAAAAAHAAAHPPSVSAGPAAPTLGGEPRPRRAA